MKGVTKRETYSVVVMMGSNLGDRMDYLRCGRLAIKAQLGQIVRHSSIYETAAWGEGSGKAYLNQMLIVQTTLRPLDFIDGLLHIEKQLGRVRKPEQRYGDRTLDLDIIYVDDLVLKHERLSVPHPRMMERNFVLVPLVELLPEQVHPESGMTSRAMLNASPDNSFVKKVDEKIK
jgi:2-amino-4-hydroxy-6-hydroxymethyldihydropteridine diphosphokinase